MIKTLFTNKKAAAVLSIISNLSLIILKLITGFLTGSVSIISEAIHSASDLLASFITFIAVNKADQPADSDHQFGHGKYEDVAGFIEGSLIILASLYIIYEVIKKLSGEVEPVTNSAAGIAVMGISVVVNIAVSAYLFKVAKVTDSIAIYSDAQHLRTDIFSSFTVFAGLIFISCTGLHIIDAIIATIVAMIIMNTGYKICKQTMNDILDGSLPQKDIDLIDSVIKSHINHGITAIKDIKTRKSGKDKEIIIILLVDGNLTVLNAHNICDIIENEIEKKLGNTKITIHIEPVETGGNYCEKVDI